jgi:hypothetical protein
LRRLGSRRVQRRSEQRLAHLERRAVRREATGLGLAHFADDELADSIIAVHDTINGLTRDQLMHALGYWRSHNKDIKRIWESGCWDEERRTVTGPWEDEVSKTKLAEALWPTLSAKIDLCRIDAEPPLPEIVEVAQAPTLVQRWRYPAFAVSQDPEGAAASE